MKTLVWIRTCIKKLGLVPCAIILEQGKWRLEDPWSLIVSHSRKKWMNYRNTERPCQEECKGRLKKTPNTSLWPHTHVCGHLSTQASTHTQIHTHIHSHSSHTHTVTPLCTHHTHSLIPHAHSHPHTLSHILHTHM